MFYCFPGGRSHVQNAHRRVGRRGCRPCRRRPPGPPPPAPRAAASTPGPLEPQDPGGQPVSRCEKIEKCPFFNGTLANMPSIAESLKGKLGAPLLAATQGQRTAHTAGSPLDDPGRLITPPPSNGNQAAAATCPAPPAIPIASQELVPFMPMSLPLTAGCCQDGWHSLGFPDRRCSTGYTNKISSSLRLALFKRLPNTRFDADPTATP
jgi:hypothetical protein